MDFSIKGKKKLHLEYKKKLKEYNNLLTFKRANKNYWVKSGRLNRWMKS